MVTSLSETLATEQLLIVGALVYGLFESTLSKVFVITSSVSTMQWTKQERAFAVEAYFAFSSSIITAQCAFRNHFNIAPAGRVPDRKSICLRADTFGDTGSVQKKYNGPSRTVRTPENVERVRAAIFKSPRRSAHKYSAALGMSSRTVRRILHEELNFHPYKLAVVHQPDPHDYAARKNACEAFFGNLPEDALVFINDEVHFHISGCVNEQNMRYWSPTNPRELHEQPLHTERATVWCAISRYSNSD